MKPRSWHLGEKISKYSCTRLIFRPSPSTFRFEYEHFFRFKVSSSSTSIQKSCTCTSSASTVLVLRVLRVRVFRKAVLECTRVRVQYSSTPSLNIGLWHSVDFFIWQNVASHNSCLIETQKKLLLYHKTENEKCDIYIYWWHFLS